MPKKSDPQAAGADAEVERGVDLRIVEFHQHVVARHAEMGGAEGDEGRHVEGAHADDAEVRHIGGEAKKPALVVVEGRLRMDAGMGQQRAQLLQDAALGQGQHQLVVNRCGHRGGRHRANPRHLL